MQISQEAGQGVWYSHLFQNFPVYCDPHSQRLWHSQKAEIDVFLELSFFFDDPTDVGSLISEIDNCSSVIGDALELQAKLGLRSEVK